MEVKVNGELNSCLFYLQCLNFIFIFLLRDLITSSMVLKFAQIQYDFNMNSNQILLNLNDLSYAVHIHFIALYLCNIVICVYFFSPKEL